MELSCKICDKLVNEGTPSFFCDFCQNWFHHECNLPLTNHVPQVGSCIKCNCELFPFGLCYELDANNFRLNYFHPFFSDISKIGEIYETYRDFSINSLECRYLDCNDFNLTFSNCSSHLSFLHLNISSLPKHFDIYTSLLNSLNHEFKVLGFSETRLTDSSIPHNLDIDRYNSIFTNTKASAGGTALYISKDLKHKDRKDLSNLIYFDKQLESTFCELMFEKQENVVVGCIYKHPTMKTETFIEDFFTPLLHKTNKEKKRLVLMGDFNINLLDYGNSVPVNRFVDSLQSLYLLPSISLPTRITDQSRTLIDNIFFTPSKYKPHSGNLLVGISDHLPQYLIFVNFCVEAQREIKYYRKWKNFNENRFIADFEQVDWNGMFQLHSNNPDGLFELFFEKMNTLIDVHAPLKRLSRKQVKKGGKPWITKGLKTSINKRDQLLNLINKEKNEQIKRELQTKHKYYRNQIVKLSRKSKINHFKRYFNDNIKNSKNIWKGVSELINRKSSSNPEIYLNIDGQLTSDPKTTSEEFNKHFSTIADKIRETINVADNDNFNRTLRNSPINSLFFEPIQPDEIKKIINSLKPRANGPVSIPTKILKTVLAQISEILARIFNISLVTGSFFTALKTAKVIPVFKNKGSPHDVNNYRPISLLSNIDKIFEKLIKSRLVDFLDENKIIFKNQFGFRNKHSTTHALINLTEQIRSNIDKGLYTCGVFIDLQKAFDTVDHEILLAKLHHYGVRGLSNQWFRSYLSNRQQYVYVSGCDSSKRPVNHGVPQGSVLGPLLFLIYINDLHYAIQNSKTNLFADDTCLLLSDSNLQDLETKINSDLIKLSSWLRANKISLNVTKTEVLLFRSKTKTVLYHMKLKLDDHILKFSSKVKYLGILLDEFLIWNFQFDTLASKLSRTNGILAKLRHFVPETLLKTLYYALFHSHISYANIVWGQALTQNSRIGKLQKKCVRILTFSDFNAETFQLFMETGIPTLPQSVFKCNIKLVHQTINKLSPQALQDSLSFKSLSHQHQTRNRNLKLLERSKAKTLTYGLKSVKYQSLLNWNQLLLHFKEDLSSISPYLLNKKINKFLQN